MGLCRVSQRPGGYASITEAVTSTSSVVYSCLFSLEMNQYIDKKSVAPSLSAGLLILRDVTPRFHLSDEVERPLHFGQELGLVLGHLAEHFHRLLGLEP